MSQSANVYIWISMYQYLHTYITLVEFSERHLTKSFKNTREIFPVFFSVKFIIFLRTELFLLIKHKEL